MRHVDLEDAVKALGSELSARPEVALVLGSGLGHLESDVATPTSVPFQDIPGLPRSSVQGHAGRFVVGTLAGVEILVQAGRYHAYEGHSMDVVVAPIRLAIALGVDAVVLTNAAGSVNSDFTPGDLVLIEDHINLMHRNPLVGRVRTGEARFPSMADPYDPRLRRLARGAAEDVGVELGSGVYAAVLGPSFETAAEVRMLAGLGVDLVGMSTVPEVIVARAAGVRCLGFSMVANLATGLGRGPIDHNEVLRVGEAAGARLSRVRRRCMELWSSAAQDTGEE